FHANIPAHEDWKAKVMAGEMQLEEIDTEQFTARYGARSGAFGTGAFDRSTDRAPYRAVNCSVSISSSWISPAITLAFQSSCAGMLAWNSGITSSANSCRDSQMSSWVLRPAW